MQFKKYKTTAVEKRQIVKKFYNLLSKFIYKTAFYFLNAFIKITHRNGLLR